VVVDIKQHKSQSNNSNFTITQSAEFFPKLVAMATGVGRGEI